MWSAMECMAAMCTLMQEGPKYDDQGDRCKPIVHLDIRPQSSK